MIFVLVLQFLGIAFLLQLIYTFCKIFKISINIHNLPILLIGFLIMLGAISLSLVNWLWYLPTGAILSAICWYLNSVEVPSGSIVPLFSKVRTSLIALFFWPQALYILVFIFLNFNKIYEKPEH